MQNELVTIVNRSTKTLTGTWNGRHYLLEGKKSYSFPRVIAEKFRNQNPVMGSEDPRTLQTDYLIAITEDGDDTTPIEQSGAVEKWDRKKLPKSAQNVDVVPGSTGLFSARDVQANLPTDSNFVKA